MAGIKATIDLPKRPRAVRCLQLTFPSAGVAERLLWRPCAGGARAARAGLNTPAIRICTRPIR